MEVGLGPGNTVLDGDPAPLPKKGGIAAPNFWLMYCCQTDGWTKMPLDMETGLGPGHTVLDGDPAPPKKGHCPPIFSPCLLWPNGRPSQLLLSICYLSHNMLNTAI